ncbi:MAG: S-layer homology domain-containing protein [Candidatus Saganbacteria bacterium]|nr:S-layer homology domain-containing protein [Candidatus Saganbacteria bacterium]
MKKIFIACIVLSMTIMPAMADVTFTDVPADHWAAKSVYDLVRSGVTTGYPDGTFRGEQKISRYETAVLLSKLAQAINARSSISVDLSKLRADIEALKTEIAAMKKTPTKPTGIPISGSFRMEGKAGNVITYKTDTGEAKRGPIVDYRLKTTLAKDLGDGASVKVNLDTMDTGFYGGTNQNLSTNLLDLEGNLKVDIGFEAPVNIKVTAGPGPVQHVDTTGVLSAESNAALPFVYVRPRSGVELSTTMGGVELSSSYIARTMKAGNTGEIDVNQVSASIGYTFSGIPMLGMLKIVGTGDYLFRDPFATPAGPKDLRGKITASAALTPKILASLDVGLAGGDGNHTLFAGGELSLADVWDTGTIITIKGYKVGTEYLSEELAAEEFDIIGLDVFNRPLTQGTVIIDGEIAQILSDKITLKGKGDIRLAGDYTYGEEKPQSSMTFEGGISYDVAPNTALDASYRVFNWPANPWGDETCDMATVGLLYKF